MSIARAVTRRIKRPDGPNISAASSPPVPSQTVKSPGLQIDRSKISSPVALISTTNMLSYNAPDIATLRKTSSVTASTHSADDSDHSISTRSRASSHASRDTLTDASSVNSSPTSPAPNHLSGYFAAANKAARKSVRKSVSSGNLRKSASSANLQQLKEDVEEPVPAIPERALSHSKHAHERLAQKRSLQNMSRHSSAQAPPSHSSRKSREHRSSLDMFKAPIQEETHPFGKELEQLNEVAEEFGSSVRNAKMEADLAATQEKNLAHSCAADYIALIQPLLAIRFGNVDVPPPLAWI